MDKNMKWALIFGSVILVLVLVWAAAGSFRATTKKEMLKSKGAAADIKAGTRAGPSGTNYGSAGHAPLGTKAQVQGQGRKHSYYFPKVERKVVRTFEQQPELDPYSDKIEDVSGPETIDGVAPLSEEERLQQMQVAPSILVSEEPGIVEENAEKKAASQNLRQALMDSGMEEPDEFLEHAPPELLKVLEEEIAQKQKSENSPAN